MSFLSLLSAHGIGTPAGRERDAMAWVDTDRVPGRQAGGLALTE